MTSSFITRADGENGTYKVIFDTDNKEYYRMVQDACRAAIDHQKPNVIPVVRCRDCKHYHSVHEYCELHSEYNLGGDNERLFYMKPEGYCNYGERRDEGALDRR